MKTYEGYIYDVLQDVAESAGIKLFANKVQSEEQGKTNFNPWLTEKSINAMKLLKSVYAICEKSNGSVDCVAVRIIEENYFEDDE